MIGVGTELRPISRRYLCYVSLALVYRLTSPFIDTSSPFLGSGIILSTDWYSYCVAMSISNHLST